MVFWRNRETTKSEKTAPGSQSLTKAYRPVMASVLKKMIPKTGKSKVGWKIPPYEGFKGKIIKLNSGFSSKPCLPKGQSFFFGSSESKYGIWCCQEIHSSHVPGLENGDIDLRFPWIFPISWWGHKRRAGDFIWNSSEKDDLKFRHLFYDSWNILEHLGRSLFTTLFFFTFVLLS